MANAETGRDLFAAARTNLRDTLKWLVTAFAALAAAILGSSPLTGLGSLPLGFRLYLAIGGGLIGLGFIFAAIYTALSVLAARPFFLAEVWENTDLRDFLEAHAEDLLPPEIPTIADFLKHRERVVQTLRATAGADPEPRERVRAQNQYTVIETTVKDLLSLANLVRLRDELMKVARRLGFFAILSTVALGVFAWAANPPKPPAASGASILRVSFSHILREA